MEFYESPDGIGRAVSKSVHLGTTYVELVGEGFRGTYPLSTLAILEDHSEEFLSKLPDQGANLPYDPRPRYMNPGEATIEPDHDLPANLTPTNSVQNITHPDNNIMDVWPSDTHRYVTPYHSSGFTAALDSLFADAEVNPDEHNDALQAIEDDEGYSGEDHSTHTPFSDDPFMDGHFDDEMSDPTSEEWGVPAVQQFPAHGASTDFRGGRPAPRLHFQVEADGTPDWVKERQNKEDSRETHPSWMNTHCDGSTDCDADVHKPGCPYKSVDHEKHMFDSDKAKRVGLGATISDTGPEEGEFVEPSEDDGTFSDHEAAWEDQSPKWDVLPSNSTLDNPFSENNWRDRTMAPGKSKQDGAQVDPKGAGDSGGTDGGEDLDKSEDGPWEELEGPTGKQSTFDFMADYQYVKPSGGGKYKIVQKGTGKTLSEHDSKEQAEEAFRAMEMNMHGGSVKLGIFNYDHKYRADLGAGRVRAYDADNKNNLVGELMYARKQQHTDPTGQQHYITNVSVEPHYRRQGIASEMLNVARQHNEIGHSDALSEDGRNWAQSVAGIKSSPQGFFYVGPGGHQEGPFPTAAAAQIAESAAQNAEQVKKQQPEGMIASFDEEEVPTHWRQYFAFLDKDAEAREAAWVDVRQKGQRLAREGHVHVDKYTSFQTDAQVQGDEGTYTTTVYRTAGWSKGVAHYTCNCEWGKWAWRRHFYYGRFCSHGYATYLEQQKLDARRRNGPIEDLPVGLLSMANADSYRNGDQVRVTEPCMVSEVDGGHSVALVAGDTGEIISIPDDDYCEVRLHSGDSGDDDVKIQFDKLEKTGFAVTSFEEHDESENSEGWGSTAFDSDPGEDGGDSGVPSFAKDQINPGSDDVTASFVDATNKTTLDPDQWNPQHDKDIHVFSDDLDGEEVPHVPDGDHLRSMTKFDDPRFADATDSDEMDNASQDPQLSSPETEAGGEDNGNVEESDSTTAGFHNASLDWLNEPNADTSAGMLGGGLVDPALAAKLSGADSRPKKITKSSAKLYSPMEQFALVEEEGRSELVDHLNLANSFYES